MIRPPRVSVRTRALAVAVGVITGLTGPGVQSAGAETAAPARTQAASLMATVALSSNDVWAVGEQQPSYPPGGGGHVRQSFAEHWDGSQWSATPTPSPGGFYTELSAVAASGDSDVWAVGDYRTRGAQPRLLALHWQGSSWTSVPVPQPPRRDPGALESVATVGADDAWAVGYVEYGGRASGLVEHWDGSTWSSVDLPGSPSQIDSVVARTDNDVWVAGGWADDQVPYSAHWDGSTWTQEPATGPSDDSWMSEIVSFSPRDAIASGGYFDGETFATAAWRWNGKAWKALRMPTSGASARSAMLLGLSATSDHDVWAVGFTQVIAANVEPLIEHWDGSSWTVVSTPKAQRGTTVLGVSALSKNAAWAVGYGVSQQVEIPEVLRWNGRAWRSS
jgi:hypothetical protein